MSTSRKIYGAEMRFTDIIFGPVSLLDVPVPDPDFQMYDEEGVELSGQFYTLRQFCDLNIAGNNPKFFLNESGTMFRFPYTFSNMLDNNMMGGRGRFTAYVMSLNYAKISSVNDSTPNHFAILNTKKGGSDKEYMEVNPVWNS